MISFRHIYPGRQKDWVQTIHNSQYANLYYIFPVLDAICRTNWHTVSYGWFEPNPSVFQGKYDEN